jgi:hypothetical protein
LKNPLHDDVFRLKYEKLTSRQKGVIRWLIDKSQDGEAKFQLGQMRDELRLPSSGACVALLMQLQHCRMIKRKIQEMSNINLISFITTHRRLK